MNIGPTIKYETLCFGVAFLLEEQINRHKNRGSNNYISHCTVQLSFFSSDSRFLCISTDFPPVKELGIVFHGDRIIISN